MQNLRRFTLVFAVVASVAFATGCADHATLHVHNQSDFSITEIHVTDIGNPSWGPNLLDGDTLEPGESLTLGVACGTYDALLVDEQGVDCEIHDIDLCLNHADWIIRNNTCGVFGEAKAAREAAAAKAAKAGIPDPAGAGPRM
jgi:hypothetical protein